MSNRKHQQDCDHRIKKAYLVNVRCGKDSVINKCTAWTNYNSKKVYLGRKKQHVQFMYVEWKQNEMKSNVLYGNNTAITFFIQACQSCKG